MGEVWVILAQLHVTSSLNHCSHGVQSAVCVMMVIIHIFYCVIVTYYVAGESPFHAQDVCEELAVGTGGDTIDAVGIGGERSDNVDHFGLLKHVSFKRNGLVGLIP